MSNKSLTLHLINKQLKIWYRELDEMNQNNHGDKMWRQIVQAKINKLERRRDTFLSGSKLKPVGRVVVSHSKVEQTQYTIQNEINKWLEKNDLIETM